MIAAAAVAKKPRNCVEPPTFKTKEDAAAHCRRESVSHKVHNGSGRYTLTHAEVKDAFLTKRADFIERRESGDQLKVVEAYRAFKLRDKYDSHREFVRQLCVEIHPWLHWGTKA